MVLGGEGRGEGRRLGDKKRVGAGKGGESSLERACKKREREREEAGWVSGLDKESRRVADADLESPPFPPQE